MVGDAVGTCVGNSVGQDVGDFVGNVVGTSVGDSITYKKKTLTKNIQNLKKPMIKNSLIKP